MSRQVKSVWQMHFVKYETLVYVLNVGLTLSTKNTFLVLLNKSMESSALQTEKSK